jgi:hypothetical protein
MLLMLVYERRDESKRGLKEERGGEQDGEKARDRA